MCRPSQSRATKQPDEVRTLIDNAPYRPNAAKDAGLIDGVAYRPEIEKELKTRLGYKEEDPLRLVRYSDYDDVRPESVAWKR